MRRMFGAIAPMILLVIALLGYWLQQQPGKQPTAQVLGATVTTSSSPVLGTPRPEYGVADVVTDDSLGTLANQRAQDMVARQYYAHRDTSNNIFSDYLNDPSYACENLLLSEKIHIIEVYQEWLASESHKACLLHPTLKRGAIARAPFTTVSDESGVSQLYVYVFIAQD